MRKKKAIRNTFFALLNMVVSVVCAFLLPRLILTSFGSSYNGLVNVISQLLGFASLFQAGIGAVTIAAYYKPLAQNDPKQISIIFKTTEIFMTKVAFSFVAFAVVIAVAYPFAVQGEFDWLYTFSLVLIMSCGTFMSYFFGTASSFLITAKQLQLVNSIISIISTIINTLISVLVIKAGYGIREAKLASSITLIVFPLILSYVVKRRYRIDRTVRPDNSLLSQRWNAFWQQVASFICVNTNIVILTLFSTVYEVSVYAVYRLVIEGMNMIFTSFSAGIGAAFGNMLAVGEQKIIRRNFLLYEEFIYILSCFLFTVTAVMIVPFVRLYTNGVNDADYIRETFAFVFCLSALFRCLHIPYQTLTNAAGHFKQFQTLAIIEVIINVVTSLALVKPFGILGVVIGTLLAYIYRTILYSQYVYNKLIYHGLSAFLKRIIVTLVVFFGLFFVFRFSELVLISNYGEWFLMALIVSATSLFAILAVELIFFRSIFLDLIRSLLIV